MKRKTTKTKAKFWSRDHTLVSCTSLTTDWRFRPVGHNNIHNLRVLTVCIENAHTLQ